MRYNLEKYGTFVPPIWRTDNYGDHVLKMMFGFFEMYRHLSPKPDFSEFIHLALSQVNWGNQQYQREHVYQICLRVHQHFFPTTAAPIGKHGRPELPKEWLEEEKTTAVDTAHAVFLDKGIPAVVLYSRESQGAWSSIAPMVLMCRTGDVFLVTHAKTKGFFKAAAILTLKAQNGSTQELTIPMAMLAKGYEQTAPKFLAWVEACSHLLKTVPPSNSVFSPPTFA